MAASTPGTGSSIGPRALATWMDAAGLPGDDELPEITRLSGGSQNELFSVSRGGADLALRMTPWPAPAGRIDTMAREFRVLEALRDTDVPHARIHGGSMDPEVLGAPFYVMDRVDGWSVMNSDTWPAPFDTDLDARAGLAIELVDGIARLARVDWKAVGLEGFGRPDGFHDRQVDRWLNHLATFQIRELPGLDLAAGWLRAHRPRQWAPGIMHGDYQFANVMYRHGAPARLAAIIDWEMATVGDPLLDLGWALINWPAHDGGEATGIAYVDYTGMPPRAVLLDHYETVSGRPTPDIDYYVILARFKLAIVLEASVARRHRGEADDRVAAFDEIVVDLMRNAAELARVTP